MLNQKQNESFSHTLRREWRELKTFYITDEQAESLKRRSFIGRSIVTVFYILKAFYFRLSPVRRALFLLALFFLFSFQAQYQTNHANLHLNLNFWGGVLLMFLLLLELKDKLLIKDEILAARAIQNALIPESQPHIQGFDVFLYYQPMNEVGGDLVDHIRLDEQTHLLALADISGKGLSAALLMSKLQGLIHAFAHDTPFEGLMATINQKFFYSVPKQSFASMLLLQIRENASVVRTLNAGHLPPIFWRNGHFVTLGKGGLALGLTETQQYKITELELKPGDILLCYSDGLSEAFNLHGEQFGEQRIQAIIKAHAAQSAQEITEAILQQVEVFVEEQNLSDDLTLIVLKKDKN